VRSPISTRFNTTSRCCSVPVKTTVSLIGVTDSQISWG
jgi:hypothetical protein